MDARIRYTKMRIKEAFYQVIGKNPLKDITVKEICEIAEINRATFYKHYLDVFDLMEKTEQEYLGDLQDTIDREINQGREGNQVLMEYLFRIAVLQWPLSLLGGSNGAQEMKLQLARKIVPVLLTDELGEFMDPTEEHLRVGRSVMEYSVAAILQDWIQSGTQTAPEIIEHRISALISSVGKLYGEPDSIQETMVLVQPEKDVSESSGSFTGLLGRLKQVLTGSAVQ